MSPHPATDCTPATGSTGIDSPFGTGIAIVICARSPGHGVMYMLAPSGDHLTAHVPGQMRSNRTAVQRHREDGGRRDAVDRCHRERQPPIGRHAAKFRDRNGCDLPPLRAVRIHQEQVVVVIL